MNNLVGVNRYNSGQPLFLNPAHIVWCEVCDKVDGVDIFKLHMSDGQAIQVSGEYLLAMKDMEVLKATIIDLKESEEITDE